MYSYTYTESVCIFRYASEVLNKKIFEMQLSICFLFFLIFTDFLTFVKYVYEVSNELQMKKCFRSSVWQSLTVANIYWRKKFVGLHNHDTSLTTLYLYFKINWAQHLLLTTLTTYSSPHNRHLMNQARRTRYFSLRAKCYVRLAWLLKRLLCRLCAFWRRAWLNKHKK